MTDKGFNPFDECASRYVHLFPEEEECISCSREGSKKYTSGRIAISERVLTEINESGAIGPVTKLKNLSDIHSILLGAVEKIISDYLYKKSYIIASDLQNF